MTLRLWLLDGALAATTELVESFARTFTVGLSEAGHASFALAADDPLLASVAEDSLVRFDVDDVARFTMIVEAVRAANVDEAEEFGQHYRFEGRSLLVEWEDSVVAPALGWDRQPFSDRRLINFADPSYDDSAWTNAVATTTNTGQIGPGGVPLDPSELQPPQRPEGFPTYYTAGAGGAFWIWSEDSAGPSVPAGWSYFRKPPASFVLSSPLKLHIQAAFDDAGICYVDGIPVLREPGWYRGQSPFVEVDLDAGEHWVAIAAENQNAHKAGLLFTAVAIDGAGPLLLPAALSSDEDWLTLGYPPSVPGFTPGALTQQLLDEAQARAEMTGWVLTSSGSADSDATPWPSELDFACDVGQSMLSALEQLAGTDIEFLVAPSARSLDLYVVGGAGAVLGVVLDGTNLVGLAHESQRALVNSVKVRWGGGQFEVEDAASIAAHGRRSSLLRLESFESRDEAQRVAESLLGLAAEARTSTSAVVVSRGAGHDPLVDFGPGDWIDCPDRDGTPVSMRVRTVTLVEDPDGNIVWPIELRHGLVEEEERLQRIIRRGLAGAFGGLSESVSFVPPRQTPTARDFGQEDPVFSHPGPVATDFSGEYTFRTLSRIIGATVRCGTGTSDTVIVASRNGTPFSTITIPAASEFVEFDESHADWPDLGTQFYRLDSIEIECTTAGGHTNPVIQFVGVR